MLEQAKYYSDDTIAAIASGIGGALLVLRISGKRSQAISEQILLAKKRPHEQPREVVLCEVVGLDGKLIDQATAVFYKGPASYTGEDALELFLHGSPFVASKAIAELHALGVRRALPGEFSFRAVRNGKLTVSQAEAVRDLIESSNDRALEYSLERLLGGTRTTLDEVGDALRKTASHGELGIDFSDQDIDELGLDRLKREIEPPLAALRRLSSTLERGLNIQEGVKVAFAGLPNAGKSSLFNALLGEDRSIVSDVAGTTRDLVREKITLKNAVTFRFEDTAGIRETDDQVEKEGVERAASAVKGADILLFVVDPSMPLEAIKGTFQRAAVPTTRVLGAFTKSDLHSQESRDRIKCESVFRDGRVKRWIATSAKTGEGIHEVADALVELAEKPVRRDPGETLLTKREHQLAVERAAECLDRALSAPELDLFAADVRQALHALGPLIGETVPDDILGRIFSGFCIGK